MKRSAIIEGRRRYLLGRVWDESAAQFGAIMANPSIADGFNDDLSVLKLIGFGKRNNFGGYELANIHSSIATNPGNVDPSFDPTNRDYLVKILEGKPLIIIAWGDCECVTQRDIDRFWDLVTVLNVRWKLWCFGKTKRGNPRHVSRLPYSTPLVRWT